MSSRDHKQVIREAERRGWESSFTRGGHIKLRHAVTGAIYFCAATPSDRRATTNLDRALRRIERTGRAR